MNIFDCSGLGLFPTLAAPQMVGQTNSASALTEEFGRQLGQFLPGLLLALVYLIVGWLVATVSASLVKGILNRTNLDDRIANAVLGQDQGTDVPVEQWAASLVYWIILTFTLVASLQRLGLEEVSAPLNNFLQEIFAYLPRIGGAIALLAIAWAIATIVKLLVTRGLSRFNLDDQLASQMGTADGRSPVLVNETVGDVLYWFIFLLFLPLVLSALSLPGLLTPVEGLIDQFLTAIPKILTAGLVLVIGWFVARLLAVMTTPLNVMLLLPDAVLVLWRFRRDRRVIVSFVIALALVGVIWLPFARALQEALPQFLGGWVAHQPKPGPIRMAALLTGLIAFWPTSDLSSLRDIPLNISTWGHKDIEFVFYMLFTIVLVSVLSVGMWKMVTASRQFVRPERWWLMMWAFLPTIVIAGVSWMSGSIWRERYLMFVAPYAILLIAAGICYLWRHYRRGAIALAILYGIASGGGLGHYYTTLYHDDWRGIAALIESREQPSDVIGFYGWEWEDPQLTVPRYYEGEAPFYVMSKQSIPPLPQESEAADRFIQDMLQNLPPTESQYWLVYYEPSSLKRQRLREAIEQRFEVKDRQEFYNSVNAELHVYQVAPIR